MTGKKKLTKIKAYYNNSNLKYVESFGKAWRGHGKSAKLVPLGKWMVTSKTLGRVELEAFDAKDAVRIVKKIDKENFKKQKLKDVS
jgi:predicted solute-binding protein